MRQFGVLLLLSGCAAFRPPPPYITPPQAAAVMADSVVAMRNEFAKQLKGQPVIGAEFCSMVTKLDLATVQQGDGSVTLGVVSPHVSAGGKLGTSAGTSTDSQMTLTLTSKECEPIDRLREPAVSP